MLGLFGTGHEGETILNAVLFVEHWRTGRNMGIPKKRR